MIRTLLNDRKEPITEKCKQKDVIVRTGVVNLEEEVRILEKAGHNFANWLEKNYDKETRQKLAEEREGQLNDLDYKEELDKIDHAQKIEKQLKENKEELQKLAEDRKIIEEEIKNISKENNQTTQEN